MKSSVQPLTIIMISLFGFFIIITHYSNQSAFKYSGKEMLGVVQSTPHLIHPDAVDTIKDVELIDVRAARNFLISHRDGAINIPLSALLYESNKKIFQNNSVKVILSDDLTDAYEAWMLLAQLGYQNLFVFEKQDWSPKPKTIPK